ANTFGRGSLVLERGVPTPVVPLESVVSFAGVTKVFVIESNVARSRTVQTGRIRDGLQEIVEGAKPGETIAVTGQSRLSDGVAVTIQAPGTASQAERKSTSATGKPVDADSHGHR